MLTVNHLTGFGVGGGGGAAAPQAVPQGVGAAIGNHTFQGGLAAAFDGVASQGVLSCAQTNPSINGYGNTLGKLWGTPRTICAFRVYGPSDSGFIGDGSSNGLKLQGSNDGANWTDLWTGVYPAGSGASVTVAVGVNVDAAYQQHRINLVGNGVNSTRIAEIEFTELA